MDERNYEQAVRLCDHVGALKLGSGRDLRTELSLDGSGSFWGVTAPFLVLYRLPQLFSASTTAAETHVLRPWKGRLSRLRDWIVAPRKSDAGCRDWPERTRTILFLGFMKTFYRDVLSPVAERLVTNEGYEAVVLGESASKPDATSDDPRIRFQSLWEHWNRTAETERRALMQKLESVRKAAFEKFRSPEFGRDLPAGVNRKALRDEIAWLFIREFPRLLAYHVAAKHVLQQHRPVLIVSADDADQRCRVFSAAGRVASIPAFLIQQGLSKRTFPEWTYFSHDKVAAMSETSKSDMVHQGVAPEKIVVTGNPGFDRLLTPDSRKVEKIRTAIGLKKGQTMVLFASQPYYAGVFSGPAARRNMMRALAEAAGQFPEVVLVVKPHPGERIRELKSHLTPSPNIVFAGRTADITDLIHACDTFVTFFSTSAVQAMMACKPVITLDSPGSGGADLYTKSGATWVARSEQDIIGHFERLTAGHEDGQTEAKKQARARFLGEMNGVPDGKAAERVVQSVLEMMLR